MSKKINKPEDKRRGKGNQKKGLTVLIPILIVVLAGYFLFVKKDDNKPVNNIPTVPQSGYTSFNFKKQGELTFTSSDGGFKSKIEIEIADNDRKRQDGLMYRDKMREDRGMLFIFSEERVQSFWMRNTLIPLDMIFVDKDNRIVTIRKNAEPFKDNISYSSTEPALYVVEVNAGYTDKYKINVDDKIVWRRI